MPRAQELWAYSSRHRGTQPRSITARNRFKIGRSEIKLPEIVDLIEREIRIIGAVGDLRDRHELHQRRHRRRMSRVGGVVIKLAEFGLDAVRRKAAGTRITRFLVVERLDAAGKERNGAAGVREQPLDVRLLGETAAEQE